MENDQGMKYLFELFEAMPRGGPGDRASTLKALSFCSQLPKETKVLDIGCGHGLQTIELARVLQGEIIALDFHQPFLDILKKHVAAEAVLNSKIITKKQSMLEMDFPEESFDLIWSEGALYNMGFAEGLKRSYELLKNNGYIAVSEPVYTKEDIPDEVIKFWEPEYPDISDINSKLKVIKEQGFEIVNSFVLPKSCWMEEFYIPMEKIVADLKKKYTDNQAALDAFKGFDYEIQMCKKYSDYYNYGFFIAQKRKGT